MDWFTTSAAEWEPMESYMRSRIREMFGPDWEDIWGRGAPSSAATSWPALSLTPQQQQQQQQQQQHHIAPRRQREPAIRVDVSETPEYYIVRADVPGTQKENIRMQVDEFQKCLLIDANAKNPEVHLESCAAHKQQQQQSASKSMQEQSGQSGQSAQNPQSAQSAKNPQSPESSQSSQGSQSQSSFPGTRPSESSEQQQMTRSSSTPSSSSTNQPWQRAENLHLNERRTGLLHRTIRLPKNVNTSCLCTQLENGVLTVVFEKMKEPEHVRTVLVD